MNLEEERLNLPMSITNFRHSYGHLNFGRSNGRFKGAIDKFAKILSVGFKKHEMGLIPVAPDEATVGDIAELEPGVKPYTLLS